MPDQTVQVSFTAPNTWTFDPPEVTMTAAGKVILQRKPGNAGWTFVAPRWSATASSRPG
jgi:hypothetical protein